MTIPVLEESITEQTVLLDGTQEQAVERGPKEIEFDETVNTLAGSRETKIDPTLDIQGLVNADSERATELLKTFGQANKQKVLDDVAANALDEGNKEMVVQALSVDPEYSRYRAASEEMIDIGGDMSSVREAIIDQTNVLLLDNIIEESAAQSLVNKHMLKASEQLNDQNWYQNLADLGAGITPGWNDLVVHNIIPDFMKDFWPGQEMLNLSQHFRESSIEEKERILDHVDTYFKEHAWNDNPQTRMLILSEITGFTQQSKLDKNFFTLLEAGGIGVDIVTGSTIAKAAFKGVSSASIKHGSRDLAAETAREILEKGTDLEKTADALESAVLPSIINPQKSFTGAPVNGLLERKYIDSLLAPEGVETVEFKNLVKTLDDNEREVALLRTMDEMRAKIPAQLKLNGKQKMSIDIGITPTVKESKLTGSQILEFKIGAGSDGQIGFVQPRYARLAANRMGIKDFEITGEDGQFFIRWSNPVTEDQASGWINGKSSEIRHIGGWWRGTDTVSPERFNQVAHLMADSVEEVNMFFRESIKPFSKLKGKQRQNTVAWLEKSRENEKWYTASELKKAGLSEKEIKGYKAYQRVEDTIQYVDNATVWHGLNSKGFKTVRINGEFAKSKGLSSFDAKPIENIDNPSNLHFFNTSTGETVTDLSKADLEVLDKQGYRIFQLQGDEKSFHKTPVQYVLAKKAEVNVQDLRTKQLRYLAGGRRRYSGDTYIKQPNIGRTGSGVAYVKKSKTLAIAEGQTQGKAFVNALNEVLDGYKQVTSGALTKGQLTDLMQDKLSGFSDLASYEQLSKMIKDGTIDPNVRFEAVKDGGTLTQVNALINKESVLFNAEDLSEANSIQRLISLNGDSYSHRGAHLKDVMGETAPVLDPAESIQKSMSRLSRTVTTGAFKRRAQEEWFREFSGVLKNESNRKSAQGHFLSPSYIDNPSSDQAKMIQKARAQKTQIDNVLGSKTLGEQRIESMFEAVGETFSSTPVLKNLKGSRPIEAIKSFAFHSKLGLFAIDQMLVQSSALVNSALMSGVNPIKATSGGLLMRWGFRTDNPATVDMLSTIAKGMGWEKDEFKTILSALKDSKKYSLKHGIADVDLGAETVKTGYVKSLTDAGMTPFMVVEEQNRINSFIGAHINWSKRTGKKKAVTDVERSEIGLLADTYAGNMSQVSKAAWQRGVASVPTQFLGYQARLIESFLNSQLSTGKRIGLAGGLLAAWGGAGVFGDNVGDTVQNAANDAYKGVTGEDLNMWVRYGIKNGGFDTMWLALTGSQQNFYERLGPGFRNNFIADMITGDKTAAELLLGAGGNMVVDTVKDLGSYSAKFFQVLQEPEYSTADAVNEAWDGLVTTGSEQIKSWSNTRKMITALQMGQYLDKKGNVIVEDLTTLDSIMLGLGIKPSDVANYYTLTSGSYDQSKLDKEVVDEIRVLKRDYLNGSITYEEFMKKESIALLTYRDDPVKRAEISYRGMFDGEVRSKIDQIVQRLTFDSGLADEAEFIRKSQELEGE